MQKYDSNNQCLDISDNPESPITFLHAENVIGVNVMPQPHSDFVVENDTMMDGSGDSDTI